MGIPARRFKHILVTRKKHKLIADGDITIHVRQYRDKSGKKRTVIAGPGLREAKG